MLVSFGFDARFSGFSVGMSGVRLDVAGVTAHNEPHFASRITGVLIGDVSEHSGVTAMTGSAFALSGRRNPWVFAPPRMFGRRPNEFREIVEVVVFTVPLGGDRRDRTRNVPIVGAPCVRWPAAHRTPSARHTPWSHMSRLFDVRETVVVVGTNVGFTLLSTAERDALDREAPQRRL